ncbi:hypothetical protein [Providencia stuartii]|uniref:hypothetical protein n=1 Tax=Providencia stuartii TaxID=588 RepID=UPI002AA2679F|nr:hypothetical protein [Providencia stuartii]
MKKLIVTAVLASSFLLFGCGDPNQEIIDKVTKHIESRKDMFPYKLEFRELHYTKGEIDGGMLCGEIKLSQKSSIPPSSLPKIIFSNGSNDIGQVIGSNDYFGFIYFFGSDFEAVKENDPIQLNHPYDQEQIEFWRRICKK